MLLYLVRHGQTTLNGKGIIQGHLDPPLSIIGREQAERLGKHLAPTNFQEIWCSDLLRAAQTAEGALDGASKLLIKNDHRLRARHMGSLQGEVWTDDLIYPDDVESDADLADRLVNWLRELIAVHTPPSSKSISPVQTSFSQLTLSTSPLATMQEGETSVLVVTHEECLLSLVAVLTGSATDEAPPSPLSKTHVPRDVEIFDRLPNTAVAILKVWWEDESGVPIPRGKVESWGQTDHLLEDSRALCL